ncbi:polyketide synthase dehydratase domain-containing protein [Paenibacillus sp. HN-1]|uniref:phosphopantetheine-binding protein n=1 Tax=Paenibacillus TaxID=44249 RepID=UPI001CA8C018|nr:MULTISPECIES: phosphopantetheine-binding protein [Paenibacillus]MBY9081313.1 polyketide synthase dehydratase domain-containing protein [Paenibacillus sp. CGMCC 1.18879]MBY9085292.1 polyketide synthase dehydratase domain-containing protein [Paenibacillus sinensis]
MNEQFLIGIDNPILGNHKVYGQALLPGLAYIDMLYQFFRENGYDYTQLELRDLTIYNPLIVEDDRSVMLHIQCSEIQKGQWQIRIEGQEQANGILSAEKKHYVSAEMHQIAPVMFIETIDVNLIKQSANAKSIDEIYEKLRDHELVHSGFIKAEGNVYTLNNQTIMELSLGQNALPSASGFMFHPTLIDGSGIGAVDLISNLFTETQQLFLPLVYESFRASALLQQTCYARIPISSIQSKHELISFALEFFNEFGKKVGELNNLSAKLVREPGLINAQRKNNPQSLLEQPSSMSSEANAVPDRVQIRSTEMEPFLQQLLANQVKKPAHLINTRIDYYEMGLDSSGLLEMVHAIEAKLKVKLPPTLLFEYTTIAELATYLIQNYAAEFNRYSNIKQTIE